MDSMEVSQDKVDQQFKDAKMDQDGLKEWSNSRSGRVCILRYGIRSATMDTIGDTIGDY